MKKYTPMDRGSKDFKMYVDGEKSFIQVKGILTMFVALEISHLLMFWLKDIALQNIAC